MNKKDESIFNFSISLFLHPSGVLTRSSVISKSFRFSFFVALKLKTIIAIIFHANYHHDVIIIRRFMLIRVLLKKVNDVTQSLGFLPSISGTGDYIRLRANLWIYKCLAGHISVNKANFSLKRCPLRAG